MKKVFSIAASAVFIVLLTTVIWFGLGEIIRIIRTSTTTPHAMIQTGTTEDIGKIYNRSVCLFRYDGHCYIGLEGTSPHLTHSASCTNEVHRK